MSAIRQQNRRELALFVAFPALMAIVLLLAWQPWHSYAEPAGTSIFRAVAGSWDWEGADGFCSTNPHTISFSPDTSIMYLTGRLPWSDKDTTRVAVYDLFEHTQNRIQGKIRGETRLDESGQPVVWDLILTSHDSYQWHRVGWASSARTKTVRRCTPRSETVNR
jgi:hypothetical protein